MIVLSQLKAWIMYYYYLAAISNGRTHPSDGEYLRISAGYLKYKALAGK